jgi:anti-sigma factor RsiW
MKNQEIRRAPEHEEMDLLLPWFVNGTLSAEARRRVAAHLEACARCREEEQLLRALEAAVLEEPSPTPSPALLRDTLAHLPQRAPGWRDRVAARLAPPELRTRRIQWAAAVAGAVLVLQTVVIGGFLGGWLSPATYEPLSVSPTAQGSGPRLVVAFQEGVSERTMRETLQMFQATIIAGPSPLGFYTVELPSEEAARVEQRLAEIRARNEVIRFAERAP